MKKAQALLFACMFALPMLLIAQTGIQKTNPAPQPQEQNGQNPQKKTPPTKVFMPNKNYKRIAHTGEELPTSRKSEFTLPESNSNAAFSSDAKLAAAAPKYRQSTEQRIAAIQSKLDYLKSMNNSPENRLQIAQLEQQLVAAYQQLSVEKECTSQH